MTKKERLALHYGQNLREAMAAARVLVSDNPTLASIVDRGEVFEITLNMNASSIAFQNRAGNRHSLGYMWDWLESRSVNEIAQNIIEKLDDAVSKGRLP